MGSDPPGRPRDEDGVVRPDDLDFTRDDRVAVLRDGRYVIATEGAGIPDPGADAAEREEGADGEEGADAEDVRSPAELIDDLGDRLERVNKRHGFAIAARFDGEVSQRAVLSDDLGAVFDELLTWAASRIDDDTPPEVIIGILLVASGRTVRYPRQTLEALLTARGLDYDDSIGDLVRSISEDGLTLPPEADGGDR
ncbi:MAG: hypothetical protein ABEJ28_03900 [Salinigranum sp.]